MLPAGRLRHRIILQRQQESQDSDTGAIEVVWVNVATLWSEIKPISAREFVASQAEASRVTTRITIRYRADVTAKMRLFHQATGFYYNIEGVLPDPDSGFEYLTLPCSQGIRYVEGDPDEFAPVNLIAPFITGDPDVGEVVTASNGTWANEPDTFTYQWYLNGLAIPGETNQTLTVPDNVGSTLTVVVTATNSGGSAQATSQGVVIGSEITYFVVNLGNQVVNMGDTVVYTP